VSTTVVDLVAVFAVSALFVIMLSLLCFCVLPFSAVNIIQRRALLMINRKRNNG